MVVGLWSVFPIPGRTRFGIKYIATPIFLQQLGAFSPDKAPDDVINEFLDFLPGFFKLIDLCVGQKADYDGYRVTEKTNLELDLSVPYEKLWAGFSPNCKRNVELSSKKRPELVSDITPDEIIDLFIRNKGKEIKGIKPRDYQQLRNLMNFCLKNRKGRIIGVRAAKKRLIFGVFIIETHGVKILHFTVNTEESRNRRLGYFVVNELIKTHSSTRTILDFAGSSIPSIASYMLSYGCVQVPFYRIYRNRLFWPVRIMK